MTYRPPQHPLEVLQQLNYDEPVRESDPKFVDLDAARGEDGLTQRLAPKFQLDLRTGRFFPTRHRHVLLFGPVGSGKSTELLRFADAVQRTGRIFPVVLNVRSEIDINNLQYADMLMALATALTRGLKEADVEVPSHALDPLRTWFKEEIYATEGIRELSAEFTSEASLEGGIPFFAKLLSKFTAKFKNTSSTKESLREVVKKSFTQFVEAFNQLVLAAEQALRDKHLGERVLLIVDGTDKIPLEDAERLFVYDTEQLLAVQAYVLYTAPITLKYAGVAPNKLDADEVLPIVKLYQRDGTKHEAGWSALRLLLDRRIDSATFADPALKNTLIEASGGHPRELLRLLRLACELTRDELIRADVVEKAIVKLAAEYRYWLQPEDYTLLADVDASGGVHVGNDERTRNLLWRLALLHYNDGSWRRSHPVVRLLEGYQRARANLGSTPEVAEIS